MTSYSPCGINCQDCEAYIATQNEDMEVFKKHQANFREQFGKDITIEELHCDGCMASGRKIGFCDQCQIRLCCIQKGFSNCAECADLPCEKGNFIWVEGSQSLANLKSLL